MNSRFADSAYAMLRIVAGAMFAFHGVQKIFGVLTDQPKPPVGDLIWIGGIIELTCGVLIALGLFTRFAAFLASGTMAVAYFKFHWKFQTDEQFFPTINGGELAVLYCFLFFYMTFRGSGCCSLDAGRSNKRAG